MNSFLIVILVLILPAIGYILYYVFNKKMKERYKKEKEYLKNGSKKVNVFYKTEYLETIRELLARKNIIFEQDLYDKIVELSQFTSDDNFKIITNDIKCSIHYHNREEKIFLIIKLVYNYENMMTVFSINEFLLKDLEECFKQAEKVFNS